MFYENKIKVIDRVAIVTPTEEISYAEMLANIRRFAQYTPEQKQELLAAFDKSAAALLRIGVSRSELMARLAKEE